MKRQRITCPAAACPGSRRRIPETRSVKEQLQAGPDFQDHLARFLENYHEPWAAATFAPEVHHAGAVITFLTPGLRFFHQGQRQGKRARIPTHLDRGPAETLDTSLASFTMLLSPA